MKTAKKIYAIVLVFAVALSSCFIAASAIKAPSVTIDFEDGQMGNITIDNSQLGANFTDATISDAYNDPNANINHTKKLYPGENNSIHFANYFADKAVADFSFDMYAINNMHDDDPSASVRMVQLDATHKLLLGKKDQTTFRFVAYAGSAVNTVEFPVSAGINWFSVKLSYIANTVYASIKEYNSDEWTEPAVLCSLSAAPADFVISNGWISNDFAGYYYMPIDNVIINYKDDQTKTFEQNYGALLSLTNNQLDNYYSDDYDTFKSTVADINEAISVINNGTAEFKADNAVALEILNALSAHAAVLDPSEITLDFEDNGMGDISIDNSNLRSGESQGTAIISDVYNDADMNINRTKKLYPGTNNSIHFASYFAKKTIDSLSFDMYAINHLNGGNPDSLVRLVQLDATHKIIIGKADATTFRFVAYGDSQVNTVDVPVSSNINWFKVIFSYVGNTVYATAKEYNNDTVLAAPAALCTLSAAPADLVVSNGWVLNDGSYNCLPIDNIYIKYKDEQTVEFEQSYGALLSLTNAQLDDLFADDYTGFKDTVGDINDAIAYINNGSVEFKANNASNLQILNALAAYAVTLDPNEVTIDFENGSLGKITIDNSHLDGSDAFGDYAINNNYNNDQNNINQTKKLYPGHNNSIHFASYLGKKTVTSFSFDMYGINNLTGTIRVVQLDATHKVQLGKLDQTTFRFVDYNNGTAVNTVDIPVSGGINWFTPTFSFVGNTVYASVKEYNNSSELAAPAELCTLSAAPTDIVISNGWVDNAISGYFYLPIDNINIKYKSEQAEAFEAEYSYLLNVTDAQLEDYHDFDYTRFQSIVSKANNAVAAIAAGDDELKEYLAAYSVKLSALLAYAEKVESGIVTVDFEDGRMGDITIENNGFNTGTSFSDPVIQNGFNTGATKQFFPGCNNSMHLSNYFDKAVKSVSIDMYFNGQWNNWEATSLIRKIEFDDHYSINVCVEGGFMHYRVYKDGAWYNEIQDHVMSGCEANQWYTVVISYDEKDVYISAKLLGTDTLSTPVKLCTLDADPADLAVSTGWVEQANSIYSLPIDNVAIKYYDTNPFFISVEQGAYIRTKSENGFGNGISFKTVITANPNFKTGTVAEFYYGTLAMDTENLGTDDSLLTYEMATVANSKGFLAKRVESSVAVSQLGSVTDWRTSIVSSQSKGTTVLDFGNKNQTIRSFIRYRLNSDPVGRYRFIYTDGNSVSRSFYQTAVNAYNANISRIAEITGISNLTALEGNTENNAITALYYLGKYGYNLDAAITSHAVYQALDASANS